MKPVHDTKSEPGLPVVYLHLQVYSLHLFAFEGAMHVRKSPAGHILSYAFSAFFFY